MKANLLTTDFATGQTMHVESKPSICFVALNAYNVLSGRDDIKHVGGAEVQQALIARELVARGYCVSFITEDHGQDDDIVLNGIRILKAYRSSAGLPILRFFHPRITGLWRAMGRADADIYYQRTSDSVTGIVAAFCRRRARKFVFAAASDADCTAALPHCEERRERVLYRYGLRRVDGVVTQTVTQQRLLQENFGIDSTIIRNFGEKHRSSSPLDITDRRRKQNRFLWIGRFVSDKRIELLLDLADHCHDVIFDVLGDGNSGSSYVQSLLSRAASIPNVHLHGRVSHAETGKFYRQAVAVICTSRGEGFPNTFLEAWSRGVPVISTFDPDNLIAERGLGVVASDVSGLANGIRTLSSSTDFRQELSRVVRSYFLEAHTAEAVMPCFERFFGEVVRGENG